MAKERSTASDDHVAGSCSQRPGSVSGTRVTSNLAALGTAAVLAVYSAGYLRTRSAAQRFAVEEAHRRLAVPSAGLVAAVAAPPQAGAVAAVPESHGSPGTDSSSVRGAATPPAPAPREAASQPKPARSDSRVASGTPPAATPNASGAAGKSGDSTTRGTTATTAVSAAAPATDSTNTGGSTQTADSAAQSAEKDRVRYRDGTYSGWGTSRHGDIQATVEIKDGRIISATITQCLTRYSCSWIDALPGQVVARQSPETDYVSGATQSTNAFYYAVVEALSKAK